MVDCWPTVTLPKLIVVGERFAPVVVPNPESATRSGVLAEFEAMLNWPVRLPVDSGEKVALIVQIAFGRTVPQLFVCEKFPVGVTPETTRFAVPQLVTTTGRLPELVPTAWLPKLMLGTLRHTAGEVATPVPVTVLL